MPATATLSRQLARGLDPAVLMEDLGLEPDPWQAAVLRSSEDRLLLLNARQTGKSTVSAVLALHALLFRPGSLTLVISPSQRQSGELARKIVAAWTDLGRPVPAVEQTALTLRLANDARLVSLPSNPDTVRGFSGVGLLIVDEAAMVEDAMLAACAPMLATSMGRMVALSTPMGRRGWFHDQWHDEASTWGRVKVMASECPRIPPEFLEEQRRTLGERWYAQEYCCSFEETIGQVFSTESVLAAFSSEKAPLFGV